MNSDAGLVLPRRAMVHSGSVHFRPATEADLDPVLLEYDLRLRR